MYNTNSYRAVKYENEEWAATDINQKDLDFLYWRNVPFKKNIVSSIELLVQSVSQWYLFISWMIDSAPILPAHKSVWSVECFDLSDRSLSILNEWS